jgi:hypothetical protein
MAEWKENGSIDRFLLDPGVQLERGRGLVKDPGDVPQCAKALSFWNIRNRHAAAPQLSAPLCCR